MRKQAYNPYLPSYEYIPDGEPYVFDGRVYVYGSHDKFNGKEYCMNNYACWSAPINELGDWRYEGIIYDKTQDPLWVKDNYLYAPDLQKGLDGRYYLYYCLNRNMVVSVAVCDSPAGKFEFYGHVKYDNGILYGMEKGDVYNFDPGVLVDDGRIFLYTGFAPAHRSMMYKLLSMAGKKNEGAYCVELEKDMLTIKSGPKMLIPGDAHSVGSGFEGHEFFEASSMRKVNGKYYFVYSSVNGHELCYATSNRADGDFIYGGTLISNGDIGLNGRTIPLNYTGNNHGSIVEIDNKWYVFYHRQTNRHEYSRQGCAESIEILSDGSIPQVEMTSCGLNGGPLQGKGYYDARIACNLSSVNGAISTKSKGLKHHPYFTQSGEDREENGDQYIANLCDGAWAGFKYFSMQEENKITVRVRGKAYGTLSVHTCLTEKAIAIIPIDPSSEWKEFSSTFCIKNGVHALYFVYHGKKALDFNGFILE